MDLRKVRTHSPCVAEAWAAQSPSARDRALLPCKFRSERLSVQMLVCSFSRRNHPVTQCFRNCASGLLITHATREGLRGSYSGETGDRNSCSALLNDSYVSKPLDTSECRTSEKHLCS